MKTLVIYDSLYGNTKTIAQSIAEAIPGMVKMVRVDEAKAIEIGAYDLLIVGGPTHGGGPSETMKLMLEELETASVADVNVAAFDTRVAWWWLRPFGYAAPNIAGRLKAMGGQLVLEGEGFFVTGGKGPLKDGEIERAAAWGEEIVALVADRVVPS